MQRYKIMRKKEVREKQFDDQKWNEVRNAPFLTWVLIYIRWVGNEGSVDFDVSFLKLRGP